MPLTECMRTTTPRQLMVWSAWFREQWNNPSRNDVYLMQVAAEVRRTLVKKPRDVKVQDFELEFGEQKPKEKMSVEEEAAIAKARWLGVMTAPVTVVNSGHS